MDAQVASMKSGLFAKNYKVGFLCNLVLQAKKQHLEKFPCVGLFNPPSGFLCLTFCEMEIFCKNNPSWR
jgi:hypothetical protein